MTWASYSRGSATASSCVRRALVYRRPSTSYTKPCGGRMPRIEPARPILFCGDPHGQFDQVITAAGHTKAAAVILLGDMEPARPLEVEMAPLDERGVPWFFIAGNHDADSDDLARRVWSEATE